MPVSGSLRQDGVEDVKGGLAVGAGVIVSGRM